MRAEPRTRAPPRPPAVAVRIVGRWGEAQRLPGVRSAPAQLGTRPSCATRSRLVKRVRDSRRCAARAERCRARARVSSQSGDHFDGRGSAGRLGRAAALGAGDWCDFFWGVPDRRSTGYGDGGDGREAGMRGAAKRSSGIPTAMKPTHSRSKCDTRRTARSKSCPAWARHPAGSGKNPARDGGPHPPAHEQRSATSATRLRDAGDQRAVHATMLRRALLDRHNGADQRMRAEIPGHEIGGDHERQKRPSIPNPARREPQRLR